MSDPALRILVVDDERSQRDILEDILCDAGYVVEVVSSAAQALERLEKERFGILLTDLRMPQMDGHDLFLKAKGRSPDLLVILMTAYATVESAVEAMREGAFDYVQKPFSKAELIQRIGRAERQISLQRENRALRRRLGEQSRAALVGESPAMQKLTGQLEKIARGRADVLITGESGTGKELAARWIHQASSRVSGPFVAVNCAAIPDGLAESEIFGHEKGAFTSATAARPGRFEQADGGSLFLDEIGSMPPALQPKLLRVLQDRVVERVGGTRAKQLDVRVIAATNRDLPSLVDGGSFREDLYHRLNVLEVLLPPLREREGDVPLLARLFRDRAAERSGISPPEIGSDLMGFLESYPFPGNVRELEHLMEKLVVLSEGECLSVADLPPSFRRQGSREPNTPGGNLQPEALLGENAISLPDVEERLLREAIRQSAGNLSEAAKRLGISYKTMQYRARKFGLS